MKLRNKLLFILPLISVITSCGDTTPEIPEVTPPESPAVFWEQSHLSMLGWKGNVKEVKETSFLQLDGTEGEEGEEFSSAKWKFDNGGRLTYYNPTGIEPEVLSRGIWQDFASYFYEYDESGRLSKVIVDDFSGTLTTYALKYGEHAKYVPLIFPLGPFEFFMVKGLESIICTVDGEDDSTTYQYSENKASSSKESWVGLETTIYEYLESGNYPFKKTVTLARGESIESQETTLYSYNVDGSLSLVDISVKEMNTEIERTKKRYLTGTLQLVSQKTDAGGQTFDWTYSYDENNRWLSTSYIQDKGSSDEVVMNESCNYSMIDHKQNWLETIQIQNSMVDFTHADGTVKVCRDISYY